MSLAKGRWRAVGTVIGATMALILVGAFAQTPELFILALALWTGACTLIATLLRSFRTYAAVLAAYTAAIIALASGGQPGRGVRPRGVARLLHPDGHRGGGGVLRPVLDRRLPCRAACAGAKAITDAARMSAVLLRTGELVSDGQAHHGLHPLAATITLETQIEFAVAEVPGLSVVANDVRAMVVNLLTLLSAAQGAGELRRAGIGSSPALAPLVERTAQLLDGIGPDIRSTAPALRLQADPLRRHWKQRCRQTARAAPRSRWRSARCSTAWTISSSQTAECLDHEIAVVTRHPVGGPAALAPPVDWGAAVRNGLRAVIGVLAGGALWIATAWPDGSSFVTDVVVICSLFGTLDNPVIGALSFLEGGLLAILAAFILLAGLMPLVSDSRCSWSCWRRS